MKTIVLCGGGTAGHVMPLVNLLPYLKKSFNKIVYFSSGKAIEHTLMQGKGVEIFRISPPAFRRSLSPSNLLIPFKLSNAVADCKKLLNLVNADVVFSKGGYCALPVCLAAHSLKIPYVCHESDLSMGLANRLTYKHATELLTVFPETANKYGGVCVGGSISADFSHVTKKQARKRLNIPQDKPLLLITGGSQGSKTINAAVEKNLSALLRQYYVLHLCGKGNMSGNRSINGYFAYEFAKMSDCLPACDLVLSRGGSNTIFEILYCKKPALITPLKKGSRGDQKKNADYFCKKNALRVCDEDFLADEMIARLNELWADRLAITDSIKELNLQDGTAKIITRLERLQK